MRFASRCSGTLVSRLGQSPRSRSPRRSSTIQHSCGICGLGVCQKRAACSGAPGRCFTKLVDRNDAESFTSSWYYIALHAAADCGLWRTVWMRKIEAWQLKRHLIDAALADYGNCDQPLLHPMYADVVAETRIEQRAERRDGGRL